jgi:hypothetical protein
VIQEPDISHLYLQDMEPRHVIALIQGAHKVMLESKFHFKIIQKRISKGIIATMCVRMKVTEIEFYAMEFDEVVLGVAKLICPVSVFNFGSLLMGNLSCKGSYFEALLNYFEDFTLLFRLLSEDNSRYVLPMEDKNFGSLQIMSGHIDEAYWIRTKA